MYQVKSVGVYYRSPVAIFFRDLVKLDDWAAQLDEVKAAEAVVEKSTDTCCSQKTQSHLRTLTDDAKVLNEKIQDIYSVLESHFQRQEARQDKEKYEKCLNALYETDPKHEKQRIEETQGGLLRGSCAWILDHTDFLQWRKDPDHQLLWIRGDPGKGKTMLMCGIVDKLTEDHAVQLCYLFWQATENLNTATAVLRGLIYSLGSQHPRLMSHVLDEYNKGGKAERFKGDMPGKSCRRFSDVHCLIRRRTVLC